MSTGPADDLMRHFAGDSVAYGTTTILSRATLVVALLVLPFLLTPRDYGALSMIVTVAALVAIAAPLEISQALARYYASAPPVEKKAYASTAWTFLLLVLAGFLVVGQALAQPLCLLIMGDLAYVPVFRIALLLMALNCLFYFLQNQCRWEFRTAEFVLISLVFAFLTLALSLGLGMVVDPPLLGVVLGQALGAAVAVGLGAFGLKRSFAFRIDSSKLRQLLAFSLPIVPASLALYLSVYASRFILNGLSSLEDVGLYTLAVQIGGIATLGIVGIQAALTPLVMKHHQKPQTPGQLALLFEVTVGFAVVACLALGLFAPELIHYAGNPAYAQAGPLVLLLAPAMFIAQLYVFAPGFAVAKRTLWQMWVSIASALVGILANFLLIPWWGITGAAVATLVASLVFLSLWFVLSQRLYPIPVRWAPVAVACVGGALLGAVGHGFSYESVISALLTKAVILAVAATLVSMIGLVPLRDSLAAIRALALPRDTRSTSRRG
jgi:O-antigen/teichoic acid export membrane protein